MSPETMEIEKQPKGETGSPPAPPAQGRSAGPLSKPKAKIILAAALAVVTLVAVLVWLYYRNRVTTDDAQVDAHLYPIASKIYGSVADVVVNDNQPVKKGQILVRIDPSDWQARVNQARSALALAQSRAQAASVTVPLTRATNSSDISAAQADVERARLIYEQASTADLAYAQANVAKDQAKAQRAHADLNRMRPLAAKAEISALQLDSYVAAAQVADSDLKASQEKLAQAKRNVDIAQASLAAAQARLRQSQANSRQVNVRAADAAAAQAAIAQAKANLESAELKMGDTTIVSPVDGVVTRRSVTPGQIVQEGQGLMVIVPLHEVYVTANFKETQLANVHPGQRAEVHVDTYGKSFPAHVDSISGASGALLSLLPPENATGNYVKVVQRIPVKIVLNDMGPNAPILRPGMNVEATVFIH